MKQFIFPFTAIVGQNEMKLSLILNAIDPKIGGVLVKGERGTAKSTAARALADLLPEQAVISGCRFGCAPDDPVHACDDCRKLLESEDISISYRKTPFINLPVSATEDRIVGTIDFEKALTDGRKHFEPGLLADVNRGILYVDEVNLLDDHIVDTLLDAAAMGINHAEREGISFTHPARFIMIGTMNPEEGDLRPQLLDRFAHSVTIQGVTKPSERVEIINRTIAFENDPENFCRQYEAAQQDLASRIAAAQKKLSEVQYTDTELFAIAELTTSFQTEGHRADIVILKTARALAAFENRTFITREDIRRSAELTLPHRIISGHGTDNDITAEAIGSKAAEILADIPEPNAENTNVFPDEIDEDKKKLKN